MAGCRLFQIGSLALGALVAAPLPAQSGAQPQVKARLDVDKPVTVPFEYFNGHIFVLLNINGSAGMPFLFDTGTSADILDLQTSQRLGLKPEKVTRQKNLGLGSDKVAMAAAKDVDVTMGGLYVANTLALLDLSGMQQVNGHRIDGILGYPLLERFSLLWILRSAPSLWSRPRSLNIAAQARFSLLRGRSIRQRSRWSWKPLTAGSMMLRSKWIPGPMQPC